MPTTPLINIDRVESRIRELERKNQMYLQISEKVIERMERTISKIEAETAANTLLIMKNAPARNTALALNPPLINHEQ